MISSLASGHVPAVHYGTARVNVSRITIHHMAGNMLAKNCVDWLGGVNPAVKVPVRSCNYAIGSDGDIWAGVDESLVSYCSSKVYNDARAITIEVANDGGADTGWHVSDKAVKSLVELCADIVQRYPEMGGSLRWENNPDLWDAPDRQNITLHNWFSATGCPGPYLEGQIPAIVRRVNALVKPTDTEFDTVLKNLDITREVIEELKRRYQT